VVENGRANGAFGVVGKLLSFRAFPRKPGSEAGNTDRAEGKAAAKTVPATNASPGGWADVEMLDGKGVIELLFAVILLAAWGEDQYIYRRSDPTQGVVRATWLAYKIKKCAKMGAFELYIMDCGRTEIFLSQGVGKTLRGFRYPPGTRTSKCRCWPFEFPVLPERPITWPTLTIAPQYSLTWLKCAYNVL
jgi:hypothetical protein